MVKSLAVLLLTAALGTAGAQPRGGQPVDAATLAALERTVFADGRGLPPGQGTVAEGRVLYAARCAACHGDKGEGGRDGGPLVGRAPLAGNSHPTKTLGQYWPYATTLFDYIRRAMPMAQPGSLRDAEVYALTAYLLAENGVVGADAVMDATRLPAVRMPHRDGFVSTPLPPRR